MAGTAKYQRYRLLADEKNMSDYRVAKEAGIAQETLSSWKRGKYVPKREKLERLANYFDVDVDFFFSESPFERIVSDSITPIAEKIQRVYEAGAGAGRQNTDYGDNGEYSIVIIRGDSMEPSLKDGDEVTVHHTSDVKPSEYAIVRINGDDVVCKHVETVENGIVIHSENPLYEDKFYSISDVLTLPINIIGKAISFERKL